MDYRTFGTNAPTKWGLLLVILRSAIVAAFLNVINPAVALSGFRSWSPQAICNKIDLFTQVSYSEIVPRLYLSNARAACDPDVLRRLNITHILTIEAHRLPKWALADTNISTLFIRAYDNPHTNILPYFPMANAFIEEGRKNGNVLVHCHFGVSRSATIVIAYLMEKYKLSFDQSFAYVRYRRRYINPNPGFISQLRQYERVNYDVKGFHRFEAYVNVNARKHKYKIVSIAAILASIIVPIVALVG